jgi:hypothetical protein
LIDVEQNQTSQTHGLVKRKVEFRTPAVIVRSADEAAPPIALAESRL